MATTHKAVKDIRERPYSGDANQGDCHEEEMKPKDEEDVGQPRALAVQPRDILRVDEFWFSCHFYCRQNVDL